MKKICFLFVLLLTFSGCSRETMDMTPEKAAEVVLTEYGENTNFVRADEDFLTTNFGSRDYVSESAVYFSENGDGNEFGFFRLSDEQYSDEMIAAVEEYINSERQSVQSLAALYPADELSDRLQRFDSATVGHMGDLVYYFITEPTIAKNAVRRFRG